MSTVVIAFIAGVEVVVSIVSVDDAPVAVAVAGEVVGPVVVRWHLIEGQRVLVLPFGRM